MGAERHEAVGAAERARIDALLARLEQENEVRILYACESGSRAWGFPSADSDYDVRFIYARSPDAYLRLSPPRDVIEFLGDDDLDAAGWDIFKTGHLFRKTNPPLMEWLDSPIVYRDIEGFAEELRTISREHFNRRACGEHYLSMAQSNYDKAISNRELVREKKYLYAIRPLCCLQWLIDCGAMPPTLFARVLAGIDLPHQVQEGIDRLVERKRDAREAASMPRHRVFDDWIASSIERLEAALRDIPGRTPPAAPYDVLLRRMLQI